jgi:coenzyme PQQ biosynthesis protein PqqD
MEAVQPVEDFIPVPEHGIEFAELEGEGVLYCPQKMTMFHVNETGSVVWSMCDGRRTVSEIIDELVEAFPDSASQIAPDVSAAIGAFVQEGILKLDRA